MHENRIPPPSICRYPRSLHGGAVHADGIVSSSVVGYSSRSVEAKHWYMIAAQFQGIAESDLVVKISDLMSMTLTPGEIGDGESDLTYGNAPMIQVLDSEGTGYRYYYYVKDAGVTGDDDDPWNQTGWIDGGTFLLTDATIDLSKGFWFYTYEAGTITCAGQVCSLDSFDKDIAKGVWQIVANPYPVALGLNSITTSLFTSGEIGDGESDLTYGNAPMIQVLDAEGTGYRYYYYVRDAGVTGDDDDPWNQTGWIDGGTFLLTTGSQVPVGQAFWIHSAGSAGRLSFSL